MVTTRRKGRNLFIAAALSLTALTPIISSQSVEAQRQGSLRQYPLLENAAYSYISSGYDGSYGPFGQTFEEDEREVIAGRKLYNTQFQMRAEPGAYTVLSTNIDINDFDALKVKIVTPDYGVAEQHKTRIILWQDGDDKVSYDDVAPGTVINYEFALDYSESDDPGSISFELQCDEARLVVGCTMYVVEAELSPTGEYVPLESQ